MFKLSKNGNIELTRGDTAYIAVRLRNKALDNATYELSEGDVLTLTVRTSPTATAAVLQKVNISQEKVFRFAPEDTENLKCRSYYYDVQLDTEAGDTFTVVGPCLFKLTEEVTR